MAITTAEITSAALINQDLSDKDKLLHSRRFGENDLKANHYAAVEIIRPDIEKISKLSIFDDYFRDSHSNFRKKLVESTFRLPDNLYVIQVLYKDDTGRICNRYCKQPDSDHETRSRFDGFDHSGEKFSIPGKNLLSATVYCRCFFEVRKILNTHLHKETSDIVLAYALEEKRELVSGDSAVV